ncbi:hypothetical protein XELAEV_18027715mg [Xenopus laevis]|uniref:GIY-YIG domain-containing protein n=1 Tax=Xenopus laevis TaxID=8355 RepID=A0A974CW00_XENLA|nr:hypothetical protein XELAEV_18027715mg [Xenopus laevis]
MQHLESAFKVALRKGRADLWKEKGFRRKTPDNLTFIISYSRQFETIRQIVKKNLPMMSTDVTKLREIMKYDCMFVSSRTPSLGCVLSPSEFKGQKSKSNWLETILTRTFVVYLLPCISCGMQYVGCTSRALKNSMHEHIGQITAKSNYTTVSRHFVSCNGAIQEPNGLNLKWDVSCHI